MEGWFFIHASTDSVPAGGTRGVPAMATFIHGMWNIYAFMTILLLPITWNFSIAPFLPNLLLLLKDRRWLVKAITLCAFIPPLVMPPWGTRSTIGLFGFFVLAGLALVLTQFSLVRSRQLSEPADA